MSPRAPGGFLFWVMKSSAWVRCGPGFDQTSICSPGSPPHRAGRFLRIRARNRAMPSGGVPSGVLQGQTAPCGPFRFSPLHQLEGGRPSRFGKGAPSPRVFFSGTFTVTLSAAGCQERECMARGAVRWAPLRKIELESTRRSRNRLSGRLAEPCGPVCAVPVGRDPAGSLLWLARVGM